MTLRLKPELKEALGPEAAVDAERAMEAMTRVPVDDLPGDVWRAKLDLQHDFFTLEHDLEELMDV